MRCSWVLFTAVPVVAATAMLAFGAGNLLINPGFEQPVLSKDSSWYSGISGWTVGGGTGCGTTWALPWNTTTPCPEGNQHVWGSANQLYLEQAPVVIQSNMVYTFTVDLYRMPPQGAGNSVQVGLVDGTLGGYLAVKEYQPTYQPDKKDFDFLTDQWTRVTVEFSAATDPTRVGHSLKTTVNSYLCSIDNAALTTGSYVRTFYVSSSGGSDLNDGLAPGTAWKSFTNANARTFLPNESLLLKRGDTWNQELNLSGSGAPAMPIVLADYGTGAKPRIQRTNIDWDRCIVINGASAWRVRNLDCRTAKLGLYLRYNDDYFNSDVQVDSCDFFNMSSSNVWDLSSNNYEYAWSAAIFLGGHVWNPTYNYAPVLDGLLISNCTATSAGQLFIANWYWPPVYKRRLRNMLITDCIVSNCLAGLMQLNCASESRMTRSRALYGGGYYSMGTTAGFAQSCSNCVIDDCEFTGTLKQNCADGSGWDFEGDCDDLRFINNVISSNDGPAILYLTTIASNKRTTIASNTFYNNCRNPWNSDANVEMKCSSVNNTGWVIGNGIYIGAANYAGTPGYFSTRWDGHTIADNAESTYASVSGRQLAWEFNTPGNFEGWAGFNQWSPSVSGGTLNGTSSGTDPYGYSGATWANTHQYRAARIRMSVTAGAWAQLFFITETDSTWDGAKLLSFPITADGAQHEYVLNLRTLCPAYQGVVTQVRLDPTDANGANIAVDYVRLTNQ